MLDYKPPYNPRRIADFAVENSHQLLLLSAATLTAAVLSAVVGELTQNRTLAALALVGVVAPVGLTLPDLTLDGEPIEIWDK
jgi:hypothetical protein